MQWQSTQLGTIVCAPAVLPLLGMSPLISKSCWCQVCVNTRAGTFQSCSQGRFAILPRTLLSGHRACRQSMLSSTSRWLLICDSAPVLPLYKRRLQPRICQEYPLAWCTTPSFAYGVDNLVAIRACMSSLLNGSKENDAAPKCKLKAGAVELVCRT